MLADFNPIGYAFPAVVVFGLCYGYKLQDAVTKNSHLNYILFIGWTVLGFVFIPGVFYSLMTFLEADFKDKDGEIDMFTCCQKSITCFFMIFFTGIMTFGFLLAEVFNPDLTRDTKK